MDKERNTNKPALKKSLGLRDLVLMNIVCIVSLATLAQVAQLGFSSISLLIICVFTFLIPSGLVVAELNSRMPDEGGFYLWTTKAFGKFHGYLAAWCYWLSNVVFLATVLLLISIPAVYILGEEYLFLIDSSSYNIFVGLTIIVLVTVLNILGMKKAKWIQNIGGIVAWFCIALLLVFGLYFGFKYGSQTSISWRKFVPDLSNFELLPFYALVPFCFGGLELAPVMAGEIIEPKKNIPKAIYVASIVVALIYILGILLLLIVLPEGEVGMIEGVAQAFHKMEEVLHIPGLGALGALLVTFGALGLFGGWFAGNARIPFVIGLDNYLPSGFAKLHPKFETPIVSLVVQGLGVAVLFLGSMAGSTIEEAFLVLLDMSIILYFIPFLYIFASFAKHLSVKNDQKGLFSVLAKSKLKVWIITFFGFSTTIVAMVLSCIPTSHIQNKSIFILKVVGGSILLITIGLSVYLKKYFEGLT